MSLLSYRLTLFNFLYDLSLNLKDNYGKTTRGRSFFIQRRVNDETDILAEKCSDNEI